MERKKTRFNAMSRVRRGTKRAQKRRKILKLAKGYYGTKSKAHRIAKQAVDRSLRFAYRDRRQKKRNFRSLWIIRINAAARENGISYNRLINGLMKAGCEVNRKMMADLAVHEPEAFAELANTAKLALEQAEPAPS
jgi:large subunit ribosomal protein L20